MLINALLQITLFKKLVISTLTINTTIFFNLFSLISIFFMNMSLIQNLFQFLWFYVTTYGKVSLFNLLFQIYLDSSQVVLQVKF